MKYILTISLGLICGFYIKSNYSTKIQTPNSPPTFNLNQEQLEEIQEILETNEDITNSSTLFNSDNLTIDELNELDLDITIGEYPDNLTIEELREILTTLERGEELDDLTRNRLNNDFYNLLEQENFNYDVGDLEIQDAMSAILDILDQASNFF